MRKILGHSVKQGGLGIPDPRLSEDSAYNIYKTDSGELVNSLLGGPALNYVGLRACMCRESAGEKKEQKHVEMADLDRRKELAGGHESNLLHRAMSNGACLSDVPHRPNSTELSREEFWDNLCLRYRLMPQDIPAT